MILPQHKAQLNRYKFHALQWRYINGMGSWITGSSTVCELFVLAYNKEIIQAPRNWPFVEGTGNRWIPLTKVQ